MIIFFYEIRANKPTYRLMVMVSNDRRPWAPETLEKKWVAGLWEMPIIFIPHGLPLCA